MGLEDEQLYRDTIHQATQRLLLSSYFLELTLEPVPMWEEERNMNIARACGVVFILGLAAAVLVPAAGANQANQMTKMTFSQPVEIPGRVLPAGSYWFVVADSLSGRNIVEILSGDRSQLDATLLTVPSYRQEATGHTEIEFAERPHTRPEALMKWYYPGRLTGHEFLYPKKEEQEFAGDRKQDVMAQVGTPSGTVPLRASGQR